MSSDWGTGYESKRDVYCLEIIRNREETNFEVEGREMERVHIKCLTISAVQEPKLLTCGRVERGGRRWLAAWRVWASFEYAARNPVRSS